MHFLFPHDRVSSHTDHDNFPKTCIIAPPIYLILLFIGIPDAF